MRRPARVLVSGQVASPSSDGEFPASTERLGSKGHIASGQPGWFVGHAHGNFWRDPLYLAGDGPSPVRAASSLARGL
jgi:hypothetical protein